MATHTMKWMKFSESVQLTSMARSTGRGRRVISGQLLDWRALISGRVSGQRIIPSPMAIEPWGLPPPDIITISGSKGSWLGLKSSPFVAFPASLYATSFWWDDMLVKLLGSSSCMRQYGPCHKRRTSVASQSYCDAPKREEQNISMKNELHES